jgi:hypothetical protein
MSDWSCHYYTKLHRGSGSLFIEKGEYAATNTNIERKNVGP